MRSTTGRESTTFGFSILVTVVFGVVQHTHGPPELWEIYLYATGAVLSFTVLEGTLSRGFRRPMPQHRTEVLALGTSMNILSVLLGLGAGVGIASAMESGIAWIIAPFAASIVYLLMESLETALAEKILKRAGDSKAEETTP